MTFNNLSTVARLTTGSVLSLLTSASVAAAQSQNGLLTNPLNPNFSSIPAFIAGALHVMVEIALPIISLFIVYAGFQFLTAQGNQEQISKAKTNFMYVIIGAILILGAWVIATMIGGTVTQLTSGS